MSENHRHRNQGYTLLDYPVREKIAEHMNTPEERFAKLAKEGNPSGIEALYRLYFEPIYRFCYWQTNRSADAEDLTQDIFIEMAKSIKNFQGRSSFKNWLYTIAKRRVLAWIKEKYKLPTAPLFEIGTEEEDWIDPRNVEKKEKTVQELLGTLGEVEREVMNLRYLKNYSVKETAEKLKISEANVKVITHRSLKKIKETAERTNL